MPSSQNPSPLARVDQYIADVLSGRQITNKWVRLAIERHVRDLEQSPASGLIYDEHQAGRPIEFIERFVPRPESGKPFVLHPWAATMLALLYGWRRVDGERRYRTAYVEIGRGNIKSSLASAIALYELVSSRGAELYSAATDRDTSKVVWSTAGDMVNASPALRQRIKVLKSSIYVQATASKFTACSAQAKTLYAHSRPAFVVLDELHLQPDDEVWNAFASALGKVPNAWMLAITNSGVDRNSVCWRQREYTCKVLDGVVPDDSWFGLIYGLDDEDEDNWEDETLWVKANPELVEGGAVKLWFLRGEAQKAKADPVALNRFMRLSLGIWRDRINTWMPADKWAACGTPVDPDALRGRQCFGGLDLSSTTDTTSFVLVFPPQGEDTKWYVLPWFFLPKDNIVKRSKQDRVPYLEWSKAGLFELTPGNVVDTGFVRKKIKELSEIYQIREIGFDRAFSADITPQLEADGLTMVPVHPGGFSQTPPITKLTTLVQSGDLAHGANPVLAFMASNLVIREDATGLLKPDKEKSRERIDGMAALLDALARAMVVPVDPPKRKHTFLVVA
jgi:phage terminase large subunit-like protein